MRPDGLRLRGLVDHVASPDSCLPRKTAAFNRRRRRLPPTRSGDEGALRICGGRVRNFARIRVPESQRGVEDGKDFRQSLTENHASVGTDSIIVARCGEKLAEKESRGQIASGLLLGELVDPRSCIIRY